MPDRRIVFVGEAIDGVSQVFSRYFYNNYSAHNVNPFRVEQLTLESGEIVFFRSGNPGSLCQLELNNAALIVIGVSLESDDEVIEREVHQRFANIQNIASDKKILLMGTKVEMSDILTIDNRINYWQNFATTCGFDGFYAVSAERNYNIDKVFSKFLYQHIGITEPKAFSKYRNICKKEAGNVGLGDALSILCDYTQSLPSSDGKESRFFSSVRRNFSLLMSGHPGRTKVPEVERIINRLRETAICSMFHLVCELKQINGLNPTGDVSNMIAFFSSEIPDVAASMFLNERQSRVFHSIEAKDSSSEVRERLSI